MHSRQDLNAVTFSFPLGSSKDVQAWQTEHPPRRGSWFTRPRVHIGFHRSWTTNDLNRRVKARIVEILKSGGVDRKDVKLYITGAHTPLTGMGRLLYRHPLAKGCHKALQRSVRKAFFRTWPSQEVG